MKAELKEMNSRMNNPEKQVSDLEDRIREITQSGEQTKSQTPPKKNESNIRDLWNNKQHANLHIKGITKGEERKLGIGSKMYLRKQICRYRKHRGSQRR